MVLFLYWRVCASPYNCCYNYIHSITRLEYSLLYLLVTSRYHVVNVTRVLYNHTTRYIELIPVYTIVVSVTHTLLTSQPELVNAITKIRTERQLLVSRLTKSALRVGITGKG